MEKAIHELTPVGYESLIQKYRIKVLPHFRQSWIGVKTTFETEVVNHQEIHIFPKKYLPFNLDDPFTQLEFAFKYDGINLEIIREVFLKLDKIDVEMYVKQQPTGKFARKIWYLYENLMDTRLDISDANRGSYTLLLDPDQFYTCKPVRSKRHYVDDNMLGNFTFCPCIRKTEKLQAFENLKLDITAKEIVEQYDPATIERAMRYLYMKETMSSFEIERERPNKQRMNRFIELLQEEGKHHKITKKDLILLQNRIVDPRFAENDYRDFQNYVGEEPVLGRLIVHYISPKPADVEHLMEGWFSCLKRMLESSVNPVVIAAALSFGFVFIHPFGDGNGRIHRFLIHYILSQQNFVPQGTVFPISATMLKELRNYDAILESYSDPLLAIPIDYEISDRGELQVKAETKQHYQYVNYTKIAEYLFECIEKTIHEDFEKELHYLQSYDRAKREIQEIVDMPNRKIDLILHLIYQNQGTLSKNKREKLFSMLTDKEVSEIEEVIQHTFFQS